MSRSNLETYVKKMGCWPTYEQMRDLKLKWHNDKISL